MNSRSNIYLKEAVASIQKGHLNIECAAEKYGIKSEVLKEAIKNYCLHGDISEKSSFLSSLFNKISDTVSFKNIFNKIAPTYDCEKEIDRFKFKFTYAAASFLLVAIGAAAISLSGYLTPGDSSARVNFEEKLGRTLANVSRRDRTVDKEIKYLNNFYSRINRILDENNSKDSKMLKEEVKKRLNYINAMHADEYKNSYSGAGEVKRTENYSRSNEIYSNLYKAASEKGDDNYMAKVLKQRVQENYLISGSKYSKNSGSAYKSVSRSASAETEELKPMVENAGDSKIEERAGKSISLKAMPSSSASVFKKYKNVDKTGATGRKQISKVAREQKTIIEESSELSSKAAIEKMPARNIDEAVVKNISKKSSSVQTESARSYKYNKNDQVKSYDGLKDKLYIINKYKHETLIKKSVAKKELKFKYPVADMIFVPDKDKYNDSFKKIAVNKDYSGKSVMITEDRG